MFYDTTDWWTDSNQTKKVKADRRKSNYNESKRDSIVAENRNASTTRYYKFGKDTVFANYAEHESIMFSKTKDGFTIELLAQEALAVCILAKFKQWDSIRDADSGLCNRNATSFLKFDDDIQAFSNRTIENMSEDIRNMLGV